MGAQRVIHLKERGTVGLYTMTSGNEGVNGSVIMEDGSLLSASQKVNCSFNSSNRMVMSMCNGGIGRCSSTIKG